jgi:hypothetical protein
MALIDVDEILGDPDFEDSFTVTRNVETIGADGRAKFAAELFTTTGVVQPAGQRSLMMLPDGSRVQGAIDIWTQEQLRVNDGVNAADSIQWHHRTYVVSNVDDFTNYGQGYVRVTCTLQNLTGPGAVNGGR